MGQIYTEKTEEEETQGAHPAEGGILSVEVVHANGQ